ncbi:MAG TPA: pyridoxal 5'-phosphate synthase glutaminase subunit PdxT [Ilumatobacter sp.]|nr:pyridoxal 5'-phosphate synthase glutaminase subunit PdxT [Ilumatobacter sp.]
MGLLDESSDLSASDLATSDLLVGDLLIGVLALQGAFDAHVKMLGLCGFEARQVRTPTDLARVDALVMPGGESTTMSKLLVSSNLFNPIADRITAGMPVFGTCAGMILLASGVLDGRPDQLSFGAIDITVRRNGYGRQVDSFETDLVVTDLVAPFHGVFIRAPKVEYVGTEVDVLASHDGTPVLLRQGRVSVASFHPELAGDPRLHQLFIDNLHQ